MPVLVCNDMLYIYNGGVSYSDIKWNFFFFCTENEAKHKNAGSNVDLAHSGVPRNSTDVPRCQKSVNDVTSGSRKASKVSNEGVVKAAVNMYVVI